MTGLSGTPAADTDTNLFSLHRRSINRRSHGRSTCCGSEKKFRNVHIRYARCAKFGCTYRGPIGVSSSRTPSESFSIHITWPTLEKAPNSAFAFKARYYCTRDGALGSNLFIWGTNYLRCLDQLEKKRPTVALALEQRPTDFQLISGNNAMRSRVAAMPIPLPCDSSTRTTEASQSVHPPGPNPRPGGSMMTSSSFEPAFIPDSE